MSTSPNSEAFYKKLKSQLLDTTSWPSIYLYKFIVATQTDKINGIAQIFDGMGAVIDTKESRNGKYTSLSIKVMMKNPDIVIAKYKEVANTVEGVISL